MPIMTTDYNLKTFRLNIIANRKIRENGLIKLPKDLNEKDYVNIMNKIYHDSWDFSNFYKEYTQKAQRCNQYFNMKYLFRDPNLKNIKVKGELWFDQSSYSPENFSRDILEYWTSFYRYASVGEYHLMTEFASECLKEPAKICFFELSGTDLFHADIPLFCKDYINDFVRGSKISMKNRKVRFEDQVQICMYPPNDFALAYDVSYAEVFRGKYWRKSVGSLFGEKDLCHGNLNSFQVTSKMLDIDDFINNWHDKVRKEHSYFKETAAPKSILKPFLGASHTCGFELFPSYPIFISPSSSGRRHLQNYPILVQYSKMNARLGVRTPPPSVLDYKPQYSMAENAKWLTLRFNSLIAIDVIDEGISLWNEVEDVEDNSGLFFDLIRAQIMVSKSKRKDSMNEEKEEYIPDGLGSELQERSAFEKTAEEVQIALESYNLLLNDSMLDILDYVEKNPTRDLMREFKRTTKNVSLDLPSISTKKPKVSKFESKLITKV